MNCSNFTLIPYELEGQIYRTALPYPWALKEYAKQLKDNNIKFIVMLCTQKEAKQRLNIDLVDWYWKCSISVILFPIEDFSVPKLEPLMGLVDTMSNLISSYEEQHFPVSTVKGISALKLLLSTHRLSQADLPEIASQGVLSEILHGKRSLNIRQIKLLAKRFGVAPSTFIDDYH